ncbi:hypothetical protein V8C35DRAFT_140183 [Trichoderma chlorosporum]
MLLCLWVMDCFWVTNCGIDESHRPSQKKQSGRRRQSFWACQDNQGSRSHSLVKILQQVLRGHSRIHAVSALDLQRTRPLDVSCLSYSNPPRQAELVIILRLPVSTPDPPPQGWLRGRTSFSLGSVIHYDSIRATWTEYPQRMADPRNESIGQGMRGLARLAGDWITEPRHAHHTISQDTVMYEMKSFSGFAGNLLTLASWP